MIRPGKALDDLFRTELGDVEVWRWAIASAGIVLGLVLAFAAAKLIELVGRRIVKRRRLPEALPGQFVNPLRTLFFVLFARLAFEVADFPKQFDEPITTATTVACIVVAAWIFERGLRAMSTIVMEGSARTTADPDRLARSRTLRTQVVVAERIASVLVSAIAVALVALQFDVVRSVGVSLLASAGLAGVVLGFAAQRSIEALLAGLQLTFSQPIRIGDTVVVEGEFGVIDDIRLTHVAVELWDKRRLIVPTPKFLEAPFENWSRSNSGLIGTVFIRVHHLTPIDAIRTALDRILDDDPRWDERSKSVQVTDAADDSLEVRIVVSARDASTLWDLRVAVREKIVTWLGTTSDGAWLPRARWSPAALSPAEAEASTREDANEDSGMLRRASR